MTTTYALVLRPPCAKDGLCPVHLRQPTYRAVPDVAMSVKHWNEAGTLEKHNWVRKTHPYATQAHSPGAATARRQPQLVGPAALNGNSADDFLAYMRLDSERRRAAGRKV